MIVIAVLGLLSVAAIPIMNKEGEELRLAAVKVDVVKISRALDAYYMDYCGLEPFPEPAYNDLFANNYLALDDPLPPEITAINVGFLFPNTPRSQYVITLSTDNKKLARDLANTQSTARLITPNTVEYRVVTWINRSLKTVQQSKDRRSFQITSC